MLFQMVFTGVLDYEQHPYSNLPNLSISSELKLVQIFYRATGKDSNYEGDFIYLFFTCHLSCSTATVCGPECCRYTWMYYHWKQAVIHLYSIIDTVLL